MQVRTHPEVVHPLADPAVLVRDFLLKVLMEARLHGGERGQRWPVVLFSWRTKKNTAGLTLWVVSLLIACKYNISLHATSKTTTTYHQSWALCLRSCSAGPAPSAPAQLLSSPAPPAVWSGWPGQQLHSPGGWRKSCTLNNIVTATLQLPAAFSLLVMRNSWATLQATVHPPHTWSSCLRHRFLRPNVIRIF